MFKTVIAYILRFIRTNLGFIFPGRTLTSSPQPQTMGHPMDKKQDAVLGHGSRLRYHDIYENIIDFCGDEDFLRDRYKTLCSCALTCKAWHQRSKENLFRRVRFRQPEQVELFVRTLVDSPGVSTLVHDLHVTPRNAHEHPFFDFAQSAIVHTLTSLRNLQIRQFDWTAQPSDYCDSLRSFTTVTSLEVANVMFANARDFVLLVQSLPALATLSCGLNRFKEPWTKEDSESIWVVGDEEKPGPCSNLTSVVLWSLDNFPPVITSLGRSVSNLQLHQPDDSWPWENICLSVSGYQHLHSISLSLVVGLGARDGRLLNDTSENPFVDANLWLLTLLLRVRSTEMETLDIHLAPSLLPTEDGLWRPTYRSSRTEAIELMFGEGTKSVLSSWHSLKTLIVHLQDNDSDHGAAWWCNTLRDSLGDVAHAMTVQVDYYDPSVSRGRYVYDTVWITET
ncbi:hypothetical protein GSI_05276 [Ganoderma sinense ZZ0214-1]|uniref:F-box domain-containing protein n=1 Tax=Ganoderma sinense ZZ0214-1 TaxID=1077348 RepID=A0A2G8SFP7_9APHY|nr:hypothetical protein GSI_05276 [Ganoderma sinense ZZ0214-1]